MLAGIQDGAFLRGLVGGEVPLHSHRLSCILLWSHQHLENLCVDRLIVKQGQVQVNLLMEACLTPESGGSQTGEYAQYHRQNFSHHSCSSHNTIYQ